MTLFIIALYAEAKPLIDQFALKQETSLPYPTYRSDRLAVVISGIGMLNASSATAYAMSHLAPKRVINYGTCGSADEKRYPIGTLWQIDKVIDSCSDHVYHLKVTHPIAPTAALHTLPKPLSDKKSTKIALADMEASGFYTAAKQFTAKEEIVILKVVSDYMEDKRLSQKEHAALQQKHIPLLKRLIENQF
jgi:nucleoside phosphorylase